MNRNASQLVQSNRPASRRLHRRPLHATGTPHTSPAMGFSCMQAPVVRLPRSMVREAGMFELLAAEVRIAELEAELAEARAAACTDPLTGALNRRGFDNACRRELSRARRSGAPLALVHVDLDDFKQVNDTFGHQVGDRALCLLVSVLQKSMRPSDVLCRFGGEEFVLMFPETSLHSATKAVARFLREFSAQPIPGTRRSMTFSAGVVIARPDELIEDAIQRADAATYAAKSAGKNCVVTG